MIRYTQEVLLPRIEEAIAEVERERVVREARVAESTSSIPVHQLPPVASERDPMVDAAEAYGETPQGKPATHQTFPTPQSMGRAGPSSIDGRT